LIDHVDEYTADALRFTNYQKQNQRQQIRRHQRDANRRNDGFDEDFERMSKMHAQSRRSALFNASQINNECDKISQYAAQGLAKLFMAQAVHEK
jgi:valyl-tRNA synthetase